MLGHLHDPDLPALQTLDADMLARITGRPGTRLLRARHQPGARAILHVALGAGQGAGEGAIWFFAGDKALRLARTLPDARHDPLSGALFQAFPQDHRMPQLATFVENALHLAPRLIGGRAMARPELMRYRPGLSATFRWVRHDGRVFYVKQTSNGNVTAQALSVGRLAEAARALPVGFVTVAGTLPDLGLIAYEAAPGQPLDGLLQNAGLRLTAAALAQVTAALGALRSLSVVPDRVLDRDTLLSRAAQAARMIGMLDPAAGARAETLLAGLRARAVRLRMRPIHADMKLEHAFLCGPQTTLIDIESLSLGDPDHDLAHLETRVTMAEVAGRITPQLAGAARAEIRRPAGRDYDWLLDCARLSGARFFAQRLDPASIPQMRRMLSPDPAA